LRIVDTVAVARIAATVSVKPRMRGDIMYRKPKTDIEDTRVAAHFQLAALAMVLGLVLLVSAPSIFRHEGNVLGDTPVANAATATVTQPVVAPTGDYFPSHYALHAPESEAPPAPTF
jgi:hypothetical protein